MFSVGERIVCINDSKQSHTIEELDKDVPNWIKKEKIYTVRGTTDNNGIVDGVWLEEIVNPIRFFRLIQRPQEPAFACTRFRKMKPSDAYLEEISEKEKEELTN